MKRRIKKISSYNNKKLKNHKPEHEDNSDISSDEDSEKSSFMKLLDTFNSGTPNEEHIESDSSQSSSSSTKDFGKSERSDITEFIENTSSEEDDTESKDKRPQELQEKPLSNKVESKNKTLLEKSSLFDENTTHHNILEADTFSNYFKNDMSDIVKDTLQKIKLFKTLDWPTLNQIQLFSRQKDNDFLTVSKPCVKSLDSSTLQNSYFVRKVLADNWEHLENHTNSMFQSELLSLLMSYSDVNYCMEDVLSNVDDIRNCYCLHVLNHVLKSRVVIASNNAKLSQMSDEEKEQSEFRDQGLTRPKVLILVPFKSCALETVNTMLKLLKRNKKLEVAHFKRFKKSFSEQEEQMISPDNMKKKPSDYQELFKGNTDEHFRFGISILSGSFRLFSPFYSSDIIISSPLGLRTVIGSKGESHYEADFLSSIEMVVMDHADVFLMQNWEHVVHIFQNMHLKPKDSHGVDFTRVRNCVLDGHSKYCRQTIVFSAAPNSHLQALFTKLSWNYKGAAFVDQPSDNGSICEVGRQLPQIYHKLNPENLMMSPDARFNFFVEKIYSQYKDPTMSHTLIFIPQYFDYIRVRNFMRAQWKNGSGPVFAHMNDYSTARDAAKARKRFVTGKAPLLLYTERYHFYNRPYIKGIRHLVFYELPVYPKFYSELCNMVNTHWNSKASDAASSASVLTMYTRFDGHRLHSILGVTRKRELLTSTKNVHLFLTGQI